VRMACQPESNDTDASTLVTRIRSRSSQLSVHGKSVSICVDGTERQRLNPVSRTDKSSMSHS
jgi:hypothetical protein